MATLPVLPVDDWTATRDTFHLWTQIVGKVRMVLSPFVNHWWHVTLTVTPRGLTTGPIPWQDGLFTIDVDLVGERLEVTTVDGVSGFPLRNAPVAEFYDEFLALLDDLGIRAPISPRPNEVPDAIPFADDDVHRTYDADAVRAFHAQLVFASRVFQRFRSAFTGKVSPVQLWWGGLDLAVTRFSGRGAPPYSGAGAPNCPMSVQVLSYDRQLSSAGFWPGGGAEGAFYSYIYPAASGFEGAVLPDGARWDAELGEYVLPVEVVREAVDPEGIVLEFLQTTFDAAARAGDWPADLR